MRKSNNTEYTAKNTEHTAIRENSKRLAALTEDST